MLTHSRAGDGWRACSTSVTRFSRAGRPGNGPSELYRASRVSMRLFMNRAPYVHAVSPTHKAAPCDEPLLVREFTTPVYTLVHRLEPVCAQTGGRRRRLSSPARRDTLASLSFARRRASRREKPVCEQRTASFAFGLIFSPRLRLQNSHKAIHPTTGELTRVH